MAKCAACNTRVEDGAVRCFSCGADLSPPGIFYRVVGWVLIALSSIPIGLGIVLEGQHDHVLLIIGAVVLVLGIALVTGSYLARREEEKPRVVPDEPEGERQPA